MPNFSFNGKKTFYQVIGDSPKKLIVIHGNSVSSKMHKSFARSLSKHYRIISPDLPGHGRSERIRDWPIDFWFENAQFIAALIDHLDVAPCHVLGYSGGALIAINLALEYPELVDRIIADSFEGKKSVASFARHIFEDRKKDKSKLLAKLFWWNMHGWDWSKVVDQDAQIIFDHHHSIGDFFHKDISNLDHNVLFTGSLHDEFIFNIEDIFKELASSVNNAEIKVFDSGKHPACLTAGKEYRDYIINYLNM